MQASRPSRSISHYLWALIFFSVVPLLCFLAYTVTTTSLAESKRFEHEGQHTAEALAQQLDLEWAKLEASLQVLADSPMLKSGNLAAFESEAREFGRHNDANVVLIEPDGDVLVNLRAHPGMPLGRSPNAALVQEVLRTGKPLITDAYRAALDGQTRVACFVPARIEGKPQLALVAAWTLEDVGRRLKGVEIPATWVTTVVDGQGVRLWRNVKPELIGVPAVPRVIEVARTRQKQRTEGTTQDGIDIVSFSQPLNKAAWTAFVGVPKNELEAPFRRSVVWLSALAALVLALSLATATTILRKLRRAIKAVEAGTGRLGRGEEPGAIDTDIRELQGLEHTIKEAGRQRAATEQALRRSETRFRDAIEGLLDAFEILSPIYDDAGRLSDLRFEYINRVGAAMACKNAEELLGQPSRALFPPGAWYRLVPKFEHVLRSGEALILDSFPFIEPTSGSSADGDVYIDLRAWRLGDQLAVTWRSVSHRILMERALQEAKTEAERANEAKSRFLAAASHDLRQPLSALALYVGMLENKLGPKDAVLHGNMKDCVGSLSDLLTDLLDVSKLDAGVVTPNPADFSICEMLARVVSAHAPEAELKRLRLRSVNCRLTGYTDPVLFSRMLGNLVDNAIRYTERGGVLVGCRRRAGKLWVEVWDTGIGIPKGKTGEIFEEFRQLENDERNRGSGLGLAIVAKTAALLGLRVRVQSQPGKGSMFALELPPGKAVRTIAKNGEASRRRVRIALVEDNSSLRDALVFALQEVGHEVIAAPNCRGLLAALDGLAPDIVISDYRIAKGETGFDVITAARAAFDAQLPAVIITGDTDPNLMRSMADRGILVQHKPIEIETLQECIAQVTRR
jgi:signal transduction histidine kinase